MKLMVFLQNRRREERITRMEHFVLFK
uniref:Uncharacterized protein n=1 Tax=Solanum lycopersicum TaxID=4081 RepID=A0A3Q7E7S1_SOLLC